MSNQCLSSAVCGCNESSLPGGLASSDAREVQQCAAKVLRQWDKLDVSARAGQHAMTRRFLDPDFSGLDSGGDPLDPPLRGLVQRLSQGAVVGSCMMRASFGQ